MSIYRCVCGYLIMLGGFSFQSVRKSFIVTFAYVCPPFYVREHGGNVYMKLFWVCNDVRHHIMVCLCQCMANICMYFSESMWSHVHRFLCCPCYLCQLCKFWWRTPISNVPIYIFTYVQLQLWHDWLFTIKTHRVYRGNPSTIPWYTMALFIRYHLLPKHAYAQTQTNKVRHGYPHMKTTSTVVNNGTDPGKPALRP